MLENRRYIIQIFFIFIGLVFLVRLFALQVADDTYRTKAERNILQRIVEYPFRGLIYDRNNELIVYNEPIYDLMVVPRDVQISDTTEFCKLFDITRDEFDENITRTKRYSRVKPSVFLKKISHEKYAKIQDQLYKFNGFYVNPRTVRKYSKPVLANELGYIGEISQSQLDKDTSGYRAGDYIGITGLEEYYEPRLRGERGVSYKMVNVQGIDKGSYKGGAIDTVSVPGQNLLTTLDLELQEYAEKLLAGKRGSVVAIEPSTGEILVMASAPSYDPNLLTGKNFGENFDIIKNDTTAPLFNRATMAQYPAGSIFKTVQALIALDEGVTTPTEQIYCDTLSIGDHAPPGYYDVKKGIAKSSNNYFYELMRRVVNREIDPNTYKDSEIGMDRWADGIRRFGFGQPTGIDIPGEENGLVPDASYYDRLYDNKPWKYSNVASLSIGQGELLVTPVQMANVAAIIANRGHYYKPHLVKGFEKDGKVELLQFEKKEPGKGKDYYPVVIDAMASVMAETAPRAIINDIEIIGKTGTAENGLKDETPDHSVFIAFAPRENPKIAIAVYVENSGYGGRAAACTASLLIEKHLRGYIKHGWWKREEYVLKGDFLDGKQN
ncbi:penicillin-binding protein 2 [Roseivirga sp. 4D4]|uniref:penicillin-binding protein 2 n=1 Tax=Roseivirga sp. 4D4 TaxID=1889784 RepID=UPI000852B867|nr:penicillin-binding protein 2 [Roseivirga sp. 4D4]OEK02525.1 penicillin-binding protein 2 [Roseivirga sp. 4D4]